VPHGGSHADLGHRVAGEVAWRKDRELAGFWEPLDCRRRPQISNARVLIAVRLSDGLAVRPPACVEVVGEPLGHAGRSSLAVGDAAVATRTTASQISSGGASRGRSPPRSR
jgi:hypothetical protein